MEDNDYVLAFDHFYTNNHIQILKSLLPFMESGSSQMLPAIIKYMELKHTLSLINSGNSPMHQGILSCNSSESQKERKSEASSEAKFDKNGGSSATQGSSMPQQEPPDISANLERIYHAVHQYLAPNEEKSFHQILSAFRTMKNMREMQQMIELIQSMNPDMDLGSDMSTLGNLGNLANLGNLVNLGNLPNMEGMGNLNAEDINDMMQLFNSLK
jgi:hypothetical protein